MKQISIQIKHVLKTALTTKPDKQRWEGMTPPAAVVTISTRATTVGTLIKTTTGAGQLTDCSKLSLGNPRLHSVNDLQEKSTALWSDGMPNWWSSPVRQSDALRTEDRPAPRYNMITGFRNKRFELNSLFCIYSVCGAPRSLCARWPLGREAQ